MIFTLHQYARIEEKKNVCRILVEKSEGQGTNGRPRCRLEDNIRKILKK
jgi:hypothetical protein